MNRRKFFGVLAAAPAAAASSSALSARNGPEAVVRSAIVSVRADGVVLIDTVDGSVDLQPKISVIDSRFDQMPEFVRM